MSNRRMFSNRISKSARFLQMPLEAQALYFHLILNADDDGVVETYPIIKMLGTADDIIKILLVKQFVIQLNEDQVMLINDWLEHNSIRPDRKVDSIYKDLIPKDIKLIEAKPRSDVKDNSTRTDNGQSMDSISKVRLGKDKLIQYKQSILDEWNKKQIIVHKVLSKDASKEIEKLLGYPANIMEKPEDVVKSILETILTYATVLNGSDYWWSHKWNLYEFLKRGYKQFEGKSPKDYTKGRGNNSQVDKI